MVMSVDWLLEQFSVLSHTQQVAKLRQILASIQHKHQRFSELAQMVEKQWEGLDSQIVYTIYSGVLHIAQQIHALAMVRETHERDRAQERLDQLRRLEQRQREDDGSEDALLALL
jgi:type II secretory pathway component PulF